MAAKHWWVISPVMEEVVPVLDYGGGPTEEWQESECVEAATKRDAIRLGVPKLKAWVAEARGDGRSPFAGVTAEPAECPHGVCTCDIEGCPKWSDVCDACDPPEPS